MKKVFEVGFVITVVVLLMILLFCLWMLPVMGILFLIYLCFTVSPDNSWVFKLLSYTCGVGLTSLLLYILRIYHKEFVAEYKRRINN